MSDQPVPRPLAVALHYEQGVDAAPRVVAKGKGIIAEKIIQTAKENGVVVEGNPVLAQALSQVNLESEIPEELYLTVAEVIGFVLRTARTMKQ